MLVPQVPGVEPGRVITTAGKAAQARRTRAEVVSWMEKIVTRTKCQRTFKVCGPYSKLHLSILRRVQ